MKPRRSDHIAIAMDERDSLRYPTIPGPDPVVMPCASVPPDGAHPSGLIPVSDTSLQGNELHYLTECVSSNWISSAGSFVSRFEDAFATAVGCEFGVACSTGTAALHLALSAVGIGPGDEVIIPTFTMIAVANAVEYTGARAVLADAEPLSWNLDPSLVAAKIGPNTKAIVAAHTYGCPADMAALHELAAAHSLVLIEDAAEAQGARCDGKPAGSLGKVASFSFYANKIVTTGEGGMVTTNDREIADKARKLRGHAFSDERHFWHEMVGFNYRMTNMQAAVGLAQTERLGQLVERRLENARRYSAALSGIHGLTLPPDPPGRQNVFWMYAILVEEEFGCSRDELRRHLAARGIETRTFFIPIHLQPIYRERYLDQPYPIAEALCRKGLYLPSGPGLSMASVEYIGREIARAASLPRQSK